MTNAIEGRKVNDHNNQHGGNDKVCLAKGEFAMNIGLAPPQKPSSQSTFEGTAAQRTPEKHMNVFEGAVEVQLAAQPAPMPATPNTTRFTFTYPVPFGLTRHVTGRDPRDANEQEGHKVSL